LQRSGAATSRRIHTLRRALQVSIL
jgi:hypothetical protein